MEQGRFPSTIRSQYRKSIPRIDSEIDTFQRKAVVFVSIAKFPNLDDGAHGYGITSNGTTSKWSNAMDDENSIMRKAK